VIIPIERTRNAYHFPLALALALARTPALAHTRAQMRPALAAVVGIAITLLVSFLGQLALATWLVAPDGAPLPIGRTLLSGALAFTFGASVLGGFVAAHAITHRWQVVVSVAVVAALSGVLSAMQAPADAPALVAWSLPVLAFVGALGGGAIRSLNRTPVSTV